MKTKDLKTTETAVGLPEDLGRFAPDASPAKCAASAKGKLAGASGLIDTAVGSIENRKF